MPRKPTLKKILENLETEIQNSPELKRKVASANLDQHLRLATETLPPPQFINDKPVPAIAVLLNVEKISLNEIQSKELRILSRETNVPVNVYIREAISDFLKKQKKRRKA